MITTELVNGLQGITDKFNSVITALYYGVTLKEVSDDVDHELKKVNTVKDAYKKRYLNDRAYLLREHVKKSGKSDESINTLYLVDNGEVRNVPLSDDEIKILKKFKVRRKMFFWGKGYHTDFIIDIFLQNRLFNVIEATGNRFKHFKISRFKEREVYSGDIEDLNEYINGLSDILFHGVSPILKTLKTDMVYTKRLMNDEIIEAFERYDEVGRHIRLQEFFDSMNSPKMTDKVKTGKDLVRVLRDMMVKTLYLHASKKDKLFHTIDKGCLDIELVEVSTLEKGDIADTLLNDYGGFIAETYY